MQIVITAVGADRSGLVGDFTGVVHSAGGNLADSRMINLRGHFALVALVEGEAPALGKVRELLREAAPSLGLTLEFAQEGPAPLSKGVPFRLKTYSMDQGGLVHRLATFLNEKGINIEELETELESAPFAGTPVFSMAVRMTVPATVSIPDLRRSLEALGDKLNCDIDLEPG